MLKYVFCIHNMLRQKPRHKRDRKMRPLCGGGTLLLAYICSKPHNTHITRICIHQFVCLIILICKWNGERRGGFQAEIAVDSNREPYPRPQTYLHSPFICVSLGICLPLLPHHSKHLKHWCIIRFKKLI